MKRYKYQDPSGEYVLTEFQILREYFPYWSRQMKKVGKHKLISPKLCMEDWVVVHWAWEI